VTDEVIDRRIQAAVDAGALAGKVCGAGGGGCVVLWVREGKRQAVADRLAADGAEILDFSYAAAGLQITET
jgi:D-glycero-alpha-D-manno-heptose-7-phosphate kinase